MKETLVHEGRTYFFCSSGCRAEFERHTDEYAEAARPEGRREEMCRFLRYVGPELPLAELLYRPQHSLILQSYKAKERKEPLNGDGFGVGCYTPASGAGG